MRCGPHRTGGDDRRLGPLLSRAEKIDLDIGEVYLSPIFREVERIVAGAASEKALRMRFAISGGAAVKRRKAEGVRREGTHACRLVPHACSDWVEVVVEDTGIGVPKEMQGFVFEKFAQVDGSATRRYGGVGLRLYICRSLIERMGGEIGLESDESGGGTRVFFRLPVS